jgi:dolichol-phosphate mannosyltransferase
MLLDELFPKMASPGKLSNSSLVPLTMAEEEKQIGIVIPVFHEEQTIKTVLLGLQNLNLPRVRVYVVADSNTDPTLAAVESFKAESTLDIRVLVQVSSSGPASALMLGIKESREDFMVFVTGDDSDNPNDIPALVRILQDGYAVASASRYARGGRHVGGPKLKHALSRLAGYISFFLLRTGTSDPTNLFKAVRRDFLESVIIESRQGFTIGIELVTKSQIYSRLANKETPTIWNERSLGHSNFEFFRWLPSYIYWFIRLIQNSVKRNLLRMRSRIEQ